MTDPLALLAGSTAEAQHQDFLRQRLRLVVMVALAGMSLSLPIQLWSHPERSAIAVTAYAIELLASLVTLLSCRQATLRSHATNLGICFVTALTWTTAWHIHSAGRSLGLLASAYVTLLTGLVVLLPWGWRPQAAATLSAAAGFLVAWFVTPPSSGSEELFYQTLVLATAGASSIFAAQHLDRYRREAAIRASHLLTAVDQQKAHSEILEIIQEVQARTLAADDTATAFPTLLDDLRRITGSRYGCIVERVNRVHSTPMLRVHAAAPTPAVIASTRETRSLDLELVRSSLMSLALDTRSVVTRSGAVLRERPAGLPTGHPTLHSVLIMPVNLGTEAVGVIALANRAEGYDDSLVAALTPFVASCSNLISAGRAAAQRREAETALRREAELTTLLARAGREFLGLLDCDEILQHLCLMARTVTGNDVALTLMWPDGSALTTPSIVSGLTEVEAERALRCRVPKVLLATLLGRAGDPDVAEVDDIIEDTLTALGFPTLGSSRLLCIPIRHEGDLVGVHLMTWRGAGVSLTESQRGVLNGVAQLANVALTNARLLADLQKANQVKTEFVSTMSHELRTPLNVILGYVEMARDAVDDAERAPSLDRIAQSAQDLLGLIEGTLEISRIESGLDEVGREIIDFPAFWADLRQGCSRIPHRPGVTLDWFEAPPTPLWSDPRRIAIIVRNLVGNALKFTEAGGVRVTIDVVGLGLVLRVQDSGIGIRREDQVAIFEMFRQADGSETRRFGGTGLGLHIVKRYTDQLGGTIVVESDLGKGATFTVTLPDAVAPATRLADAAAGITV